MSDEQPVEEKGPEEVSKNPFSRLLQLGVMAVSIFLALCGVAFASYILLIVIIESLGRTAPALQIAMVITGGVALLLSFLTFKSLKSSGKSLAKTFVTIGVIALLIYFILPLVARTRTNEAYSHGSNVHVEIARVDDARYIPTNISD